MGNSDHFLQSPYPIAMKHYDWVRSEINKFLDAQVIHSSHSSWSAPFTVVPKGDGGKLQGFEQSPMEICVAHAMS